MRRTLILMFAVLAASLAAPSQAGDIVHDAEQYVLEAQHGEEWAAEDTELDAKLAALREKLGTPPNIIHIMWDDAAVGEVGIPAIQKVRGLNTPRLNPVAEEGILFTHMYTEVAAPRAERPHDRPLAIRSGMYNVSFPVEIPGMRAEEVTIAEVLCKAGYATGFTASGTSAISRRATVTTRVLMRHSSPDTTRSSRCGPGSARSARTFVRGHASAGPVQPRRHLPDARWIQVLAEAKKGEKAVRWGDNSHENYMKIEPEAQRRTLEFIERNAKAGKPFYVANWPMLNSFLPNTEKCSISRSNLQEGLECNIDPFIGKLMAKLRQTRHRREHAGDRDGRQRADDAQPPRAAGFAETIFRGGKGDFLEGGVRVPAQAWWPGVIEPGQMVGDIIHETDLFTTFARLAGALQHIPTDRVIDGVDQTALLLKGDTHGRRDYVFIYAGPRLGATVKGNFKRHWISPDPSAKPAASPRRSISYRPIRAKSRPCSRT